MVGEAFEFGLGAAKFGDALADLLQPGVDQVGHMRAGRLARVADGQDAADLGQGEPGSLGGADELQALDSGGRVVAVAAAGAWWWVSRPACS
jgi:hypothetical protein